MPLGGQAPHAPKVSSDAQENVDTQPPDPELNSTLPTPSPRVHPKPTPPNTRPPPLRHGLSATTTERQGACAPCGVQAGADVCAPFFIEGDVPTKLTMDVPAKPVRSAERLNPARHQSTRPARPSRQRPSPRNPSQQPYNTPTTPNTRSCILGPSSMLDLPNRTTTASFPGATTILCPSYPRAANVSPPSLIHQCNP